MGVKETQPKIDVWTNDSGACRVYWGSHGCRLERGHEGPCECGCCKCVNHPDPDSGCVAKPPYYGADTRFYGEDAAGRGLLLVSQRAAEVTLTDDEAEALWTYLESDASPPWWEQSSAIGSIHAKLSRHRKYA